MTWIVKLETNFGTRYHVDDPEELIGRRTTKHPEYATEYVSEVAGLLVAFGLPHPFRVVEISEEINQAEDRKEKQNAH